MTKMAAMPVYGKNHKKIFSGTGGPISTKLMYHRERWSIIVYINLDLGLTWLHTPFNGKKMKTLNFSGSFEAYDLKVGRYKQHVEPMKCCEY